MHVPRFGLSKTSSWWSRPKVWPTSWHITRFLQAVVLYFAVLKYVSLTLVAPCVMCFPLTQIWASPSQPLLPYSALQTSTCPLVGRQFFGLAPPATIGVSSTVDLLQSEEVVFRILSQVEDTLSPSCSVNGLAVRAQW